MVLAIILPTKEEIKAAKQMASANPELLDDRELWILEKYKNAEDDFDEGVEE